jgi:hypothetical protein
VIYVLDPVGPLPASVYWRRRALVLGAIILVLLLGWALLPGGGDDRPRDSAAAAGSPDPTDPAAAPTGLSATAPSGVPGPAGDGDGVGATVSPTPTPTPPPTTPAPTVAPPTACPDSAIQVTVGPRAPAYPVGQEPIFDLRVRNTSKLSCLRDLGAGQQEVLVYRGSQRLWSSNDCYPSDAKAPTLLGAGVQKTSSVKWSGLGSRPNCAGARTRIGAGSYTVVARVGTAVARRTAFTLR